jgi:hypothetical protein
VTWKDLVARGRFTQRPLESITALRRRAEEGGDWVGRGEEPWIIWDELGCLSPVLFAMSGWTDLYVIDVNDRQAVRFREEEGWRPWAEHEWEFHRRSHHAPLYSPWQVLVLHEVIRRGSLDVSVDWLLSADDPNGAITKLRPTIQTHRDAWVTLDAAWSPTVKLLVDIQNRFWPETSGSYRLPWDPVTKQRIDPIEAERRSFDPLAALDRHGFDEAGLAALYGYLIERGARIEGGGDFRVIGGDRWARLRLLADRDERDRMRGVPAAAVHYYEAAEMLGRLWEALTGSSLPGVNEVPYRRTVTPLHYDPREHSPWVRSKSALRSELVEHGLWTGRIHAVVEGPTERDWVNGIVEEMLGGLPNDLLVTNLRGVGEAKRMEALIDTVLDYSTSTALIVDPEGDMADFVQQLIDDGKLEPEDVLMKDASFEEANFSHAELLAAARHLGAHPPGDRPKVRVRLTVPQLRRRHKERCEKSKRGKTPGLADTLLAMLREQEHGALNLKKTELSDELLRRVRAQVAGESISSNTILEQRPIVDFVYRRIVHPLAQTWR